MCSRAVFYRQILSLANPLAFQALLISRYAIDVRLLYQRSDSGGSDLVDKADPRMRQLMFYAAATTCRLDTLLRKIVKSSLYQEHSLLAIEMCSIRWLCSMLFAWGTSSLVLNSGALVDLNYRSNTRSALALPSGNPSAGESANDEPSCDEDIYGHPLLNSCRQALGNFPPGTGRGIAIGTRTTRVWIDVTVPYRWVSRKFKICSTIRKWLCKSEILDALRRC